MANHITYLFGAGASAQSMPIVSEINEQIDALGKAIELSEKSEAEIGGKYDENKFLSSKPKKGLLTDSLSISRMIKRHSLRFSNFETIDTYAKYLVLRNEENQLRELKAIVDYYFSIRHFATSEWPISPKVERGKLSSYDSRYDSLMATLLSRQKNGGLRLPPNVSFLSWNYDLEAERSYSKFHYDLSTNELQRFRSIPSMLHLNGHSTMPAASNDVWNSFQNEISIEVGKKIRYAFDGGLKESDKKKLNEIIKRTTHLVVIGYSFPTFNREIDRQILRGKLLKKITIQDRDKASGELIKDSISSLLSHYGDRFVNAAVNPKNIIVSPSANQFLVPNELDDKGPDIQLFDNNA